ncbi:MAG: recombinase RecJ [Natronomonas sp.]
MDDSLIDDETLSISRRSILPGEGFFTPDSFDEELKKQEIKETLSGADRIVVADPDADGLGCVALLRVAFGDAALIPAGPHDLREALEYVASFAEEGADCYICDLCPDSESDIESLPAVADRTETLRWFDHHQWTPSLAEAVRTHAELTVGDSETVCSTDVTLSELDYSFEERYADLAAVIRDHDLWIRDDPRSDDIADYAYWAEPEEFLETITEHGANLPESVESYLAERRIEKENLIEKAIDRAEMREIGDWTVGVTYGRCSQNEVAEALREAGADASVIVKPAGSASIRGTDAFERCHEVAQQVQGGGHPKAAGCKPDIYDDMLDFAHHWSTRGAVAKQVILDAFRNLDDDAEAA